MHLAISKHSFATERKPKVFACFANWLRLVLSPINCRTMCRCSFDISSLTEPCSSSERMTMLLLRLIRLHNASSQPSCSSERRNVTVCFFSILSLNNRDHRELSTIFLTRYSVILIHALLHHKKASLARPYMPFGVFKRHLLKLRF